MIKIFIAIKIVLQNNCNNNNVRFNITTFNLAKLLFSS